MKLPQFEQAVISEAKIVDYLLSPSRDKAEFFADFGFSIAEWQILAKALSSHAVTHEVANSVTTTHGTKYIVEGELSTPDGRNPKVRSVWIIEHEQIVPRFITAYPLK